ncbi:protein of unknown function [Pseudomonas mediterranea]
MVTKKIAGFADIRLRMANVAFTKVPINSIFGVRDAIIFQRYGKIRKQLIKTSSIAHGNIVYFIFFAWSCRGSQEICLDSVFNETEIATSLPISIHIYDFVMYHCTGPFRNDRCIGSIWILTLPKYIKIT